MTHRFGRFTVDGGPEVEQGLADLVEEVGAAFARELRPEQYRALLVIGGYGRGEGGVEVVEGRERPHNNVDFMLVLRGASGPGQDGLRRRLVDVLSGLAAAHGIGLDLGVVTEARLRHAPCLILWHDMHFGHKTVIGDPTFAPSLTRFATRRILPSDALNLLVNRGTLLLINDLLLARGGIGERERRLVVRHAVKAVIGTGDAVLFFLGDYHWSYVEKQRRMAARQDVPAALRELYEACVRFRFRPSHDAFAARDLAAWMVELRATLQPVHLACERLRLALPELTWTGHAEAALRAALREEAASPRGLARKARNLFRALPVPPGLTAAAALGFRATGPRGVLPVLFPAIAYDLPDPAARERARVALGASSTEAAALRRAYLRAWAVDGDPNFSGLLSALGLSLEDPVRGAA
jgi:hypothetical protein